MLRVTAAFLLAAAGLSTSGGLSAQARATPAEASVPFKVGETLTYDVTWSTFLVAGSAVTTVAEKQAVSGSAAYYIVADGRPIPLLRRLYNLYYKMDTLLDSVTLLPHRGSLYSEQSNARRLAVTRFDRAQRKAFFELDDAGTPLKSEFDVPPQVQDGLSAVYILRTMTFKPGDRITLPVADDGLMYSMQAEVAGREQVRVPLGTMEAWRLNVSIVDAQGQPAAKDAAVWLSSDARRLPLKLQAELPVGHFVLVLREAR